MSSLNGFSDLLIWKFIVEHREFVISQFISPVLYYLYQNYRHRQEDRKLIKNLWSDHFGQLVDEDCEGVIGGQGGLSRYDIDAARQANSHMRTIFCLLHDKIKTTESKLLSPNKLNNLIIWGGWVPCKLAENILNDKSLPYFGSVIIGDDYVFDIKKEHIKSIRRRRGIVTKKDKYPGTVKRAFIADRFNRKVVLESKRNDDGTLALDGILVTYKESYWRPGKKLLHLDGVGEAGTYLSNELLFHPKYVQILSEELNKKAVINNQSFQAVVEIILRRYEAQTLPSIKNIRYLKILKLETL